MFVLTPRAWLNTLFLLGTLLLALVLVPWKLAVQGLRLDEALVFLGLFPIVGFLAVRLLLPFWLLWCLGMSAAGILQATKGRKHRIPILHQFVEFL